MVVSFINGTTTHGVGELVELLYENATHIKFSTTDPTAGKLLFRDGVSPVTIKHAKPVLMTWAVLLTTSALCSESTKMTSLETSLQLTARPAKLNPKQATLPSVSWEKICSFNYQAMETIVTVNAPVMWHLICSYSNPSYKSSQGAIDTILGLTFTCSECSTLFPLCRGVYLFAVKAHKSLFCVESCIGCSVSFQTVYTALQTMAAARQAELQAATHLGSGCHFVIVGDNVQVFLKQRDHWIGRESQMIKGFAGTAVEMEDFNPQSFDIDELIRRQLLLEQKQLSVEGIIADVNVTHLNDVMALHVLKALLDFVPLNQINPTRHSKVFPLATNSADEISVQGMKDAAMDFIQKQLNITEENLGKCVIIFSGNGKTFDQLLKLKKYLIMHEGNLKSLRCVVPMPELWHTLWMDLSRIVRGHWGKGYLDDLSALSRLAQLAECPTPADLKKSSFS
ncbi:hypothetical protein PAXRUDRAFT_36250 [Paxillus rubicundulus Ve08.2h10]|uniref:DUF6589 domain-containing protein n=1 Tax=Paxillus rubicundulus Ve08.2h10 TaxID=930991 RepID=A0A0D0D8Z4_9AGAM|nr:hypothetical protein PAXRUDRAFT_36250 [Paxillus rubicundulus Ve08.2h10]